MSRSPFALTLAALAMALSACEPIEEEELDASLKGCAPIAGTGSGTASDPGNAADGSAMTYATISMVAGEANTGTVRVTSPITLQANTLVGVLHSIDYGTSSGVAVTVHTYSGVNLVDTFTLSGAASRSGDSANPVREQFIPSAAYDAVDLSFTRSGGTGTVTARVHEFCSNSQ